MWAGCLMSLWTQPGQPTPLPQQCPNHCWHNPAGRAHTPGCRCTAETHPWHSSLNLSSFLQPLMQENRQLSAPSLLLWEAKRNRPALREMRGTDLSASTAPLLEATAPSTPPGSSRVTRQPWRPTAIPSFACPHTSSPSCLVTRNVTSFCSDLIDVMLLCHILNSSNYDIHFQTIVLHHTLIASNLKIWDRYPQKSKELWV